MLKKIAHWITKLLAPGVAHAMENDGSLDNEKYVLIDDRGADVTLFCFSGFAALFGGLPAFEFGKILNRTEIECNHVFVRDIRRMAYCVAPDGQHNGLEFFEEKVNEIKESLGATHNIAIGASLGGNAAMHFATRCNMDKAIAFGPTLDSHAYTRRDVWLKTLFDLPLLLRTPTAHLQTFSLVLAGTYLGKRLTKDFGPTMARYPLGAYAESEGERPPVTAFHGNGCRPDVEVAKWLSTMPDVKVVPLDTPFHNCTGYLKRQGRLSDVLKEEIEGAIKTASPHPDPQEDP